MQFSAGQELHHSLAREDGKSQLVEAKDCARTVVGTVGGQTGWSLERRLAKKRFVPGLIPGDSYAVPFWL